MDRYTELTEILSTKRAGWQAQFAETQEKGGQERIDALKTLSTELKALQTEWDGLHEAKADAVNIARRQAEAASGIAPAPHAGLSVPGDTREYKSLGRRWTETPAFKTWRAGMQVSADLPDVNLKTLFSESAGFAPPNNRTDIIIVTATRRPTVADLIPSETTTLQTIKYMDETTFTNNAAAVLEGGTYGESALAYTERSQTIEKIGNSLPVTDEQMEDVGQVETLINNRLVLMVELKEEDYLLTGTGTSPQLLGFLNKSGLQTQARGSDPEPTALMKGMTLVRGGSGSGFAEPTGIVMHPNNWLTIATMQDLNGNYIFGAPGLAVEPRLWGLPVIQTVAITANTALLGDFRTYAQIWRRMGLTLAVTDSNNDDFVKGKQMIRLHERLALVIYRGAAFATVTSLR